MESRNITLYKRARAAHTLYAGGNHSRILREAGVDTLVMLSSQSKEDLTILLTLQDGQGAEFHVPYSVAGYTVGDVVETGDEAADAVGRRFVAACREGLRRATFLLISVRRVDNPTWGRAGKEVGPAGLKYRTQTLQLASLDEGEEELTTL